MSRHKTTASSLILAVLLAAACGSADESTGVKSTDVASACDTPELRQMYNTLMTGEEEARAAVLKPLRARPVDDIDPAVQRCVIEAFLDSQESGPLDGKYRPSLKKQYGLHVPHRFYQPDYLPRLVADGPSDVLVETYGREVVPLLVRDGETIDGKDFVSDSQRLDTLERTLRLKAQGRLELSAEERQQIEDLLVDRWKLYESTRGKILESNFYATLWGAYTYDLDGGKARGDLPARACELLARPVTSELEQLRVVEDLVLVEPELARKFLDRYVEVEEGSVREYLMGLLGRSHGADTAWPVLSEEETQRLARTPASNTYKPVCRTLLGQPTS